MRAWLVRFIAFALLQLALAGSAWAAWPDRPIKLVVASGPGGALDIVARAYATRLSAILGQSVAVENRAGAGALVAIQYLMQQPADGYTLLLGSANVVMTPHLYPEARISIARDLAPISPVASLPMFLAVPVTLPARDLPEFIAYAKARPGALNFGTSASGSFDRLAGADFMARAGIELATVPFKGEGQALLELLAGRTQVQMATWLTLAPHVKAGKLRVLAVTTGSRSPLVPEVPTIAEQGFSGYDAGAWFGMYARAGVPREIVQQLNRAVHEASQSAEVRTGLMGAGQDPLVMDTAGFQRMVGAETDRWGAVINRIGLKPE